MSITESHDPKLAKLNTGFYHSGGKNKAGNERCFAPKLELESFGKAAFDIDDEGVRVNGAKIRNTASEQLSWENLYKNLKEAGKAGLIAPSGAALKDVKTIKLAGSKITKSDWGKYTEDQKVVACLVTYDHLKLDKGKLSANSSIADGEMGQPEVESIGPVDPDQGDLLKTKFAFLDPKHRTNFGSVYGTVPGQESLLNGCFSMEYPQDKKLAMVYEDEINREITQACLSGDASKISALLQDVGDDVFDLYKDQLSVLNQVAKEQIRASYDAIKQKLKDKGREIRGHFKDGKWDIEKDEAEQLIAEYNAILSELQSEVFEPLKYQRSLMVDQRDAMAAAGAKLTQSV